MAAALAGPATATPQMGARIRFRGEAVAKGSLFHVLPRLTPCRLLLSSGGLSAQARRSSEPRAGLGLTPRRRRPREAVAGKGSTGKPALH